MVSSISQGTGSSLFNVLRSMQKEQAEALDKSLTEDLTTQAMTVANSQSVSTHAASSNLMSRNFASAEREESKYTQATIQGLQMNRKMDDSKKNTLVSIMQQAKLEYENAGSAGEKYKALKRAEKKIYWHQQDEVRKSAEETHLKKSKETLEDTIKEALAPKDENGNPIETGLPTGGTGEVAPMPEISGSNPTSVAPAPDVAVIATSAPEVSTPSAPSTVSIDITV